MEMRKRIMKILLIVFFAVLLVGVVVYYVKLRSSSVSYIDNLEALLSNKEQEIEQLQKSVSELKVIQRKYLNDIQELKKKQSQIKEPRDAVEVVQSLKDMGYDAYEKKD